MTSMMPRLLLATLAGMPLAIATPALAGPRTATVDMPPGSSVGWVQQQPTRFLNTDMAQVLPDGLSYLNAGGVAGGFALGYNHGMGGGGELQLGVNAILNTGGPFQGAVGAGYKYQLARANNLGVAVLGNAFLNGLGGATAVGIQLGLPLTFDAGAGHITAEPRVTFPNLSAGTAGGVGEVAVGYIAPLGNRWSILADITPTFGFGGGFTLPIGIGARFSPTANSHVDFTFGQIATTPAFNASLGLVGVQGHVGF